MRGYRRLWERCYERSVPGQISHIVGGRGIGIPLLASRIVPHRALAIVVFACFPGHLPHPTTQKYTSLSPWRTLPDPPAITSTSSTPGVNLHCAWVAGVYRAMYGTMKERKERNKKRGEPQLIIRPVKPGHPYHGDFSGAATTALPLTI